MSVITNQSPVLEAVPGPVSQWDALSPHERDYWKASIACFPPPPLMLELAFERQNIENYSPLVLCGKVSSDPVLAGRIIARANNAAFGLRSPITSLQRAVLQLGFNLVRSTIMRYAIDASVRRVSGLEAKWTLVIQGSAESGAVIAWHWARMAGLRDPSEVATRCLLSRLGTFLLARRFPEQMQDYFRVPGELERIAFEAEQFHIVTPELTARVAEAWQMPPVMQEQLARLWRPLSSECRDSAENIACAAMALSFDPPMYQEQLSRWLSLPQNARLVCNLEASGALRRLPGLISSEAYRREMSAIEG